MRSIRGRLLRVSQEHGRFIITPLKKLYKEYKQTFPRLTYHAWASQNEEQCFAREAYLLKPLISIVVPAYNTDASHLLAMVYSVVNQHYEQWELIIINASDDPVSRQQIAHCAQIDVRVKVYEYTNKGISVNTNAGIEKANGDFIAFLDHDDLLHPCALHSVVAAINERQAELIYTDEDKIKADNSMYFQPLCKPSWSPDLLRNVNYINHLTVVKKDYIHKVGGLREGFDGAQDYDFLLRVIDECKPCVIHVARVLYHWRAAATSTASNFDTKQYVLEAGTKALHEHLTRVKIKGQVKPITGRPGFYEINYEALRSISIVVGPVETQNQRLCAVWVEELSKLLPKNVAVQLVIGDWFKRYKPTDTLYEAMYIPSDVKSYWREASRLSGKTVTMIFQSGVIPDNNQSVAKVCAAAAGLRAFVSPVIVGEPRTILDAGLVEASHGLQPLFTNYQIGDDSYLGSTEWVRDVAGLTMQTVAMPTKIFQDLTKNTLEDALNSRELAKYIQKNKDIRCVSFAHEAFAYKGSFLAEEVTSDQYFNPQLTEAQSNMGITVSAWGNLADISERENVE